jgi:hypothetical protein
MLSGARSGTVLYHLSRRFSLPETLFNTLQLPLGTRAFYRVLN